MKSRQYLFFSVLFLIILMVPGPVESDKNTIIVVDKNGTGYNSIQSAVDNAKKGDTIKIHSGEYTETISINKQLHLKGKNTGRGKPIINSNKTGSPIKIKANNTKIQNLIIKGSEEYEGAGIIIESENNIIKDNLIMENSEQGILLQGNYDNNTIKDNLIRYCGNGIKIRQGRENKIINNEIKSNGNGITLRKGSKNNIIRENHISDSGWGIYIEKSRRNSIENNKIMRNSYNGLSINQGNNNSIKDNLVKSNEWNGIQVTRKSKNNTIKGNLITSNKEDGIVLEKNRQNTIKDNKIFKNHYSGIELKKATYNEILHNKIKENKGNGLKLINSTKNQIQNNKFVKDGISILKKYENFIKNNTINKKPLILLKNQDNKIITQAGQIILKNCKNITIKNTTLTKTDTAITLEQTNNIKIKNNQIRNNEQGISLKNKTKNTNIKNNKIQLNNKNGIIIHKKSFNNIISQNNISIKHLFGIKLYGDRNIIQKNLIEWNRQGLHIKTGKNNIIQNNSIKSNIEYGTKLENTKNDTHSNNRITKNGGPGILIKAHTKNSTIIKNDIIDNDGGINLKNSENNQIYLNNLMNSNYNVKSDFSDNQWYSRKPMNYTYEVMQYNFTSRLGNYYGDYNKKTKYGNGIGKNPYTKGNIKDEYPLRESIENYKIIKTRKNPAYTSPQTNSRPTIGVGIIIALILTFLIFTIKKY